MSMILFLNIVTKKKKMVEILEFDLTTLGFNVQNTLVPSRTLYRVPTVVVQIFIWVLRSKGTSILHAVTILGHSVHF